MHERRGPYRARYADFFRTIGSYLDASSCRDLTLVETPEGFIVTGYSVTTTTRGPVVESQSMLFSDADLDVLIEEAYARRGAPIATDAPWPSVTIGDEHVRYEDVLRCVGEVIEDRRWHDVVVVQTSTGFHIKGRHADTFSDEFLDAAALRHLLTQLRHHRQADPTGAPDATPRKRWFGMR